MKKILFYTNQFFGQIGGEDMAYAEPVSYTHLTLPTN